MNIWNITYNACPLSRKIDGIEHEQAAIDTKKAREIFAYVNKNINSFRGLTSGALKLSIFYREKSKYNKKAYWGGDIHHIYEMLYGKKPRIDNALDIMGYVADKFNGKIITNESKTKFLMISS